MATVGLIGETPRSGYEAAAAAFEAGDLEAAEASASDAVALVTDAPRVGRERLLAAVGTAIAIALLLGLVVALRRRRRRTGARPAVAGGLRDRAVRYTRRQLASARARCGSRR